MPTPLLHPRHRHPPGSRKKQEKVHATSDARPLPVSSTDAGSGTLCRKASHTEAPATAIPSCAACYAMARHKTLQENKRLQRRQKRAIIETDAADITNKRRHTDSRLSPTDVATPQAPSNNSPQPPQHIHHHSGHDPPDNVVPVYKRARRFGRPASRAGDYCRNTTSAASSPAAA